MKKEQHIDGVWMTSEHKYKGRKIIIKARKDHGMKAHVLIAEGKAEFTLRYSFINPDVLLVKAKKKIDRNDLLFTAWQYCDNEDKSTEFMIEYMQDMADVNTDHVMNFIRKYSKIRSEWIKLNQ